MKRTCKTIASLVMMLVLLLGIGAPAYAEGNVTYQGGAEKFVFTPGSGYTDTDLFDGFKNVMPGDVLEQKIQVKNGFFGTGSVKIYLRAVAHDEAANPLSPNVAAAGETVATMSDFLSQLSMEVWQGDRCIFTGSPDELDGLKKDVLLATVARFKSTTLTVKLQVPAELGNEYANRVGEVDWVFTAEEVTKTVQTGDDGAPILWASLMTLSLVAAAGAILSLNRKNKFS